MSEWLDTTFAQTWVAGDGLVDFLQTPRRLAAGIVEADRPGTRLVIDIGSGPGDFLAVMLEVFPEASGVWSDVSPAMADIARERFAGSASDVSFVPTDMTDLSPLPSGADLIITSRASHHLGAGELVRFYAEAAEHLAPGGWLVNLDHVLVPDVWRERFRSARKRILPPAKPGGGHHHSNVTPGLDDHLRGITEAGFADHAMPWRGMQTCMLMARMPD